MAKLGEVCTFFSGTGFPNKFQGNRNGKYPFYKVGDISKNVLLGTQELKYCENYIDDNVVKEIHGTILPPQTIVFAKIGEALRLNRRAITENYCLIDNNAMGIHTNNNNLNTRYLYYFMCSIDLQSYCESTTIPSVRKSRIAEIELPLPPLDEQRKIAAVLDKVSDLIAKRRQQLDKLDEMVKARFVEMFGTLSHPSQKFKYDILKNLCRKITDGKHGGCTPQLGSGRYFVGAREIFDDSVHYETAPEIAIDEFEKDYKRCNLEIGDLLIVNTGATIGKSAIACDCRTQHTLLQKSVALLKVKSELINPVFLKYCYRVNETMYKVESASAQPNLLLSKINTTSIYVPPMALQNQFAAFVEQTEKSKTTINRSLEKLETLKKALMQEYFG